MTVLKILNENGEYEKVGVGGQGKAASVKVGTVTTLAPNSQATVENVGTETDAVLNFGIPQGDSGEGSGDMLKSVYDTDGDGIIDSADNASKLNGKTDSDFAAATHTHTADAVTFTDGATFQQKYDSGELKGDKGDTGEKGADGAAGKDGADGAAGADGKAATVQIGTVTQLAAGSAPTVTNSGTENAAVFNFGIPVGKDGTNGTNGTNGADGKDGADGAAATVTVGTVTTGAAGTAAAVVNAGTANAAVLNFTIPRGADGEKGADGAAGADGYTPVKGTDYFTEEDKAELVEDVLAALPTWTGGSY